MNDGEAHPKCWFVSDGCDASTMDNWNPIRSIYMLANEDNVSERNEVKNDDRTRHSDLGEYSTARFTVANDL